MKIPFWQPISKYAKKKYVEHTYFKKFKNWVSFLTLIFVAFYTAITAAQLSTSNRANIISRDVLEISNKASISLNNVSWTEEPNGAAIILEWLNNGNTIAKQMQTHVNYIIAKTPLPNGFSFTDYPSDNVVFSLGAHSKEDLAYLHIANQCIDNGAGNSALVIWGWAKYRDVFKPAQIHETRFCWLMNALVLNRSLPGNEDKTFHSLCPEGNCTDEDCPQNRQPVQLPAPEICAPPSQPPQFTPPPARPPEVRLH